MVCPTLRRCCMALPAAVPYPLPPMCEPGRWQVTVDMTRGVKDFACFPDERLFRAVAEGIPLIVENAVC